MSTIEIEQDQEITPNNILRIVKGFWSAKPLLTAVRLGLFTELGNGPLFVSEIRQRIGLDSRSSIDFLDALVTLGLIERQGKGFTAIYRNSPEAATFLNRRKPEYMGNMLERIHEGRNSWGSAASEPINPGIMQNEVRVNRPAAMMAY